MIKTSYTAIVPYETLDGSEIRELMHPQQQGNRHQSLAEAIVPAGQHTKLHLHRESEELYHVTAGSGWVWLSDQWVKIQAGDTICILPGTPHCVVADQGATLRILCCCSPAYRHEDTEVIEMAEWLSLPFTGVLPPHAETEAQDGRHDF